MTYREHLEANNTDLQTILNKVNQLPEKGEGGVSIDGIPAGYTRAGYIYFTGEQEIDTGVIIDETCEIYTAFTRENAAQHYMYGVASDNNDASVTAYLGGSWRFGNKYATKTVATGANTLYSAVVDASKLLITGNSTPISGVSAFETLGSLIVGGARAADGSIAAPQYVGKMLYFTIHKNGEQVLNLVPVVNAEGTYRFFDRVSGEFFDSITDTPLGGGDF